MSHWRVTAALVCLVVLFLVALLPARLVGMFAPAPLLLEGFGGTVWQGRAARAQIRIDGKTFILGRVVWHVSPWSILLLSPEVEFESDWGRQRLSGTVQTGLSGSVSLRGVSGLVDVGFAREFIPLYVGGYIEADISALTIADEAVQSMSGRILWREAVWAARSGDVPLGNYVLDLSGSDALIKGKLVTLSGSLQASGDVELAARRYAVDGNLAGPAIQNQGLADALRLFTTPNENGLDLKLEGSL